MTVVEVGVTKVAGVEDVKYVEGNAQGCPRDVWKVLANPDIDRSVCERSRERRKKSVSRWRKTSADGDVCGPAESRRATHVQPGTAPERDQAAELDAEEIRHVHNPVGHHAKLLVVGRVLRDADGVREVEQVTETVRALH